jgi:hypothetical protein
MILSIKARLLDVDSDGRTCHASMGTLYDDCRKLLATVTIGPCDAFTFQELRQRQIPGTHAQIRADRQPCGVREGDTSSLCCIDRKRVWSFMGQGGLLRHLVRMSGAPVSAVISTVAHVEPGDLLAVNKVVVKQFGQFARQSTDSNLFATTRAVEFRAVLLGEMAVGMHVTPSPGQFNHELAQFGVASFHTE